MQVAAAGAAAAAAAAAGAAAAATMHSSRKVLHVPEWNSGSLHVRAVPVFILAA